MDALTIDHDVDREKSIAVRKPPKGDAVFGELLPLVQFPNCRAREFQERFRHDLCPAARMGFHRRDLSRLAP